jgi:hypothetical protein
VGFVAVVLTCMASRACLGAEKPGAGPQKRTLLRIAEPKPEPYFTKWLPAFLYLSDTGLFAPDSDTQILNLAHDQGVIAGLTSAPCGDLVIYALANAAGSQLMGITTAVQQAGPFADAAAMGDDAWFHDPMSLSPGRRWLLVTASSNRREMLAARAAASAEASDSFAAYPGDLWLVDCAKLLPPRRVAPDSRLSYCSWAPSGRFALCELASEASDATEPKALLLDAESAELKPLAEGHVQAAWSDDARKLRLFVAGADGTEELDFHVSAEGSVSLRSKRLLNWQLPANAVWSHDGTIGAYLWERDGRTGVSLVDTSGSTREVQPKPGVRRLIGWSCRGELLACVGGDGCLHFCVGVLSTAPYERMISLVPGRRPAPKLEAVALQTWKSPVELASPDAPAAWAESASGPCLIYVDTPGKGQQSICELAFKRMSLTDFGLDLTRNLREQIIVQGSLSHLRQLQYAFLEYAHDHGQRLPPHATGEGLLNDLDGYFKASDLRDLMASPYGGDEIRVVLLLPGQSLKGLTPEQKAQMVMAELWSDDGHLFVAYANGSVKQVY